jgi:hypothetical protein
MTAVEATVAEIDGWDDDLRVILPTAQHFRYRVLATDKQEFLRRRIAGSSGHAAGVRLPRNSYPDPGPDRNADQGRRRHSGHLSLGVRRSSSAPSCMPSCNRQVTSTLTHLAKPGPASVPPGHAPL